MRLKWMLWLCQFFGRSRATKLGLCVLLSWNLCSQKVWALDPFMSFRFSYQALELELRNATPHALRLFSLAVGAGVRGEWWRVHGAMETVQDPWTVLWRDEILLQWRGWGAVMLGSVTPFTLVGLPQLHPLTLQAGFSFLRLRGSQIGSNIKIPSSGKTHDYQGKAESYNAQLHGVYFSAGLLWQVQRLVPLRPISWIQSYGFGVRVLMPVESSYRDDLRMFSGMAAEGKQETHLSSERRDFKDVVYTLDVRVSLEEE